MDKETFLRIAPDYYATAILAHLYRTAASVSREELSLEYSIADNDGDPEGWFYFKRPPLFEAALKILLQFDIIEVIRDPFGPPIISPHRDLYTKIEEIAKDRNFPLYKYRLTGNGESWLRGALQSLDRTYSELRIRSSDFETPDDEWEPLPLERDDPLLQKTIDSVDATIEKVRSDNGYAANLPEERQYVLDGLSAFQNGSKRRHQSQLAVFASMPAGLLERSSRASRRTLSG